MQELTREPIDNHGSRFFVEEIAGGEMKANFKRFMQLQAWATFCELATFKVAGAGEFVVEVPPHNASRRVRIDGSRTLCNVQTKSRHCCI